MTTRQHLHELIDDLSDAEVEDVTRLIVARRGGPIAAEAPEMAELPDAWRTLDDGTPAPNWVATIDDVRAAH